MQTKTISLKQFISVVALVSADAIYFLYPLHYNYSLCILLATLTFRSDLYTLLQALDYSE